MDKSPMLLSLRWDNSELCHPGQQPPETGGLLSIQNVASVTRGQEFQILFDFHSFKVKKMLLFSYWKTFIFGKTWLHKPTFQLQILQTLNTHQDEILVSKSSIKLISRTW